MATFTEIPLNPGSQRFRMAVSGVLYQFVLRWSNACNCYVFSMYTDGGTPLLEGFTLVGNSPLLGQFRRHLELAFDMFTQTDHDSDTPPTYLNLGSTGHVYVVE